jgi:NAD(P)-dependent dehydrogenase (short-subunit alcohol dehydrogenase family)
VIHNAGHMVFGPAEAFTPEQLAELYDINVLSTQRVNRAALPQLRKLIFAVVWLNAYSALHDSGRYRWISVATVVVAGTVLDYSLRWKAYYPE